MEDSTQVVLIVYFYGGGIGFYRTNFKMAKWCFQTYKKWAADPKNPEVHPVIILSTDDPSEGPLFFRCDFVCGFNLQEIDREEEIMKKAQIRAQIDSLKKMGKFVDGLSSGEDWKE